MNTTEKTANESKEKISAENSMYLLVGTYTNTDSKGIYVYQFDTISGDSKYIAMSEIENPSFLAISKDEKYVYSVTENEDSTASATAFSFDKSKGELKKLNTQQTNGGAPCYISVDEQGKHVVTANYLGGSISVFTTNSDGRLNPISQIIQLKGKGIDKERQKQPHIHCVKFSSDGKYLFADDLGTDQIHKFNINTTNNDFLKAGTPESFKVSAGAGPRHLVFHPTNKYAYLITEMGGTVIAFNYDQIKGNLSQFQTVVADTLQAKGSGDIRITPDGKFLYASNRLKGDGVAIFSINPENGELTKVGYTETGIHPRNMMVSPNGKFLLVATRDSNIIQIFAINKETGLLTNLNKDIKLAMPVCLVFASLR